jgi:hypothetical protein
MANTGNDLASRWSVGASCRSIMVHFIQIEEMIFNLYEFSKPFDRLRSSGACVVG